MSNLNQGECRRVLGYMLTERLMVLLAVITGARHRALFSRLLAELEDLATQFTVQREAMVRDLMAIHVERSAELTTALNAVRLDKLRTPEKRAAAQRLFQLAVAGRGGYGHSAQSRVNHADTVRSVMPSVEADLVLLPAQDGDQSIAELFHAWLDSAEPIWDATVSRVPSEVARSTTLIVRDVNSGLAQLRAAIRLDLSLEGTALPPNAEVLLLGLADALVAVRTRPKPRSVTETVTDEGVAPHDHSPVEVVPAEPPVLIHAHPVDVEPESEVV